MEEARVDAVSRKTSDFSEPYTNGKVLSDQFTDDRIQELISMDFKLLKLEHDLLVC